MRKLKFSKMAVCMNSPYAQAPSYKYTPMHYGKLSTVKQEIKLPRWTPCCSLHVTMPGVAIVVVPHYFKITGHDGGRCCVDSNFTQNPLCIETCIWDVNSKQTHTAFRFYGFSWFIHFLWFCGVFFGGWLFQETSSCCG